MALLVYDSGECEVLVRDTFLNRQQQNQDIIYCDEVQKRDCYRVRDLYRQHFTPLTIVDIGAQIGTFSMMAAKYWPHATIHCYEPVPVQCQLLRRNVPSAVCHDTAVVGFFGKEYGNNVHQCVYHVNDPEKPYRERTKAALCVEDMLKQDDLQTIDLLKLDCEECEVNIVREFDVLGRLKDVNLIHGEWHGAAARQDLMATLRKTHEVELDLKHPEQPGGLFFCRRR